MSKVVMKYLFSMYYCKNAEVRSLLIIINLNELVNWEIFKINCESAIGQHLIINPECAKTYTDDNFRIIGQARSSFHLGVLESVYIKTRNPVLFRQK